MIRDTDRQIQETFEETFEAAARNFEELVGDVFPGGSGRLRLVSDEQAPRAGARRPAAAASGERGECGRCRGRGRGRGGGARPSGRRGRAELPGVEIEITPAGKSTKRLSLLSGGEKSMTALAFLFAVFLARPCPFYILDEVEAALDDLNLDRFLALLRRYADRAQFIVITHQKRTMEAADWLYGVSMGGDGVSKVLSRRLPPEQQRGGRRGDASRRLKWPRSRRSRALLSSRARGARLERSVHHRRGRRDRRRRGRAGRGRAAGRADGGLFRRLRESMAKTRQALGSEIQATLFGDARRADLGTPRGGADHGRRRRAARPRRSWRRSRPRPTPGELEGGEALSERLIGLLARDGATWGSARIDVRAKPTVIMAVGVNGTGKTTTIGKLAWHLQQRARPHRAARRGRHVPRGRERAARRAGPSARAARS